MLPKGISIFFATAPTDLRGGFDRLCGIVMETLQSDPKTGNLYLFTNRRRTHLKALFYDRTGFCILYKRLDQGTFPKPTVIGPGAVHVEISSSELTLILEGLAPLRGSSTAETKKRKRKPRMH